MITEQRANVINQENLTKDQNRDGREKELVYVGRLMQLLKLEDGKIFLTC